MDYLKPRFIRQVKKEIRVLGISARHSRDNHGIHLVGVVYRGGLWLDGVMRAESFDLDLTESIIKMIEGSPHHKQIRILILSGNLIEDGLLTNLDRISSEIKRPLILLTSNENQSTLMVQRGFTMYGLKKKSGEILGFHPIGLTKRESERVLTVSTKTDTLPEALRISELVVDAYTVYVHQNV